LGLQILKRCILGGTVEVIASVIHQDVQATRLGDHLCDGGVYGPLISDIQREHPKLGAHALGAARGAKYTVAARVEQASGEQTDAAGGPADQDDVTHGVRYSSG
jgi:hypothetical protein